ncbi:AMP-binding protein [Streptomyces sp. NPDC049040]|uniref:AMP-binding protein n=1 Tax=Streptomyces sp. NPDC049040 TaxID=3365593 RepID=UPI00371FDCA4
MDRADRSYRTVVRGPGAPDGFGSGGQGTGGYGSGSYEPDAYPTGVPDGSGALDGAAGSGVFDGAAGTGVRGGRSGWWGRPQRDDSVRPLHVPQPPSPAYAPQFAAPVQTAAVSGGKHGKPRRARPGGGGGGARPVAGDGGRLPGPLLRRRAERHPMLVPELPFEGRAGSGTGTAGCSFAELDRRARAVAARLGTLLSPGSRVLLVYPEGPDLAGAFFGCLYAGMAAVPLVVSTADATRAVPRAVQRCAPDLILTGTDGWQALAVDRNRTQVVEADGVRVGGEPVWRLATQWRPVGVLRGAAAYHCYHDDGPAGGRLEAAMCHGDLADAMTELAQAIRLGTDEENVGWIAAVHGLEEAVWRILLPVRVTG